MILGKKLAVVMPACKDEKTIRQTDTKLPLEYVDKIIILKLPVR